MSPIYDFECMDCGKVIGMILKHDEVLPPYYCTVAEEEGGCRLVKRISAPATYSIKGDNSASVTPKKHRKEGKE